MASAQVKLPNGRTYEQPLQLFIDNQFVQGSGEAITVLNPSTEETIVTFNGASTDDVNQAVAAARRAFEGPWSQLSANERGAFLYEIAELVYRDRELLAAIEASDCGKTYNDALTLDPDESYNVLKYYAGSADKITGKTVQVSPVKFAYVIQEPLGVCGQIIPWKYPFMMLAWKVAPALACGNTVVLKPAEQTPLSAMYFANIIKEAGIPAGVINILPGYDSVAGKHLAGHMGVDKIAFTGSTQTVRLIMKEAANNLKNITLECGGKSPSVFFADADLEQAAKWCHFGAMGNQGEICTSTSRIYVHESIYDEFLKQFVKETEKNKVGNSFNDVHMGPIVSKAQHDKVLSYIEEGKKAGARLLHGGASVGSKGYFVQLTVFADTTEDMKIVQEEIFGPVVSISKFSTEDEVIEKCNNTQYGLAAALFTENVTRAHIIAKRLQAGMVWINSSQDSHWEIPFGGYKSSGIGRELGQYAMDAYTQAKSVHVNLGSKL
ncbi:hypothetical protein CEP54_013802 [Fusarium duplospermum]|uniref:aldehyde dehydrogenase (NAD(+)) n=1 Tax=Fusarium duplospermum TaxID=1325734 RepID=A0A428P083_9HYPO|nr:hypothetical protein CEP54_013802 [Fusarium duplospermum]